VKSVYGPWGIPENEKLIAVVMVDHIEFRGDRELRGSIPLGQITEIQYNTVRSNRGADFMKSGCSGEGCLGNLLGGLVLSFFHSADHFVSIAWNEQTERVAEFEVGKDHYKKFLDTISDLSGIAWRSIPAEIKAYIDSAVRVKLENDVLLFGRRMEKAKYNIIPVGVKDGEGRLLIFRGKPFELREDRDSYDAIPVQFILEENSRPATREAVRIEYHKLPIRMHNRDMFTMTKIRFPHFTALMPDPVEQVKSFIKSREFLNEKGQKALRLNHGSEVAKDAAMGSTLVSLVEFEGQDAIRFPVKHSHGSIFGWPRACDGYLYVMADAIAYDAYHTPKYRAAHNFKYAMSEVEVRRNEIRTPDGNFIFWESMDEPSRIARQVNDSAFWGFVEMTILDFEAVVSEFRRLADLNVNKMFATTV